MTVWFEGPTCWMYLDVLGLVTTGYGNLINTPLAATALPWHRSDGSMATRDEIIAEWAAVRNLKDKRNHRGVLWPDLGGGSFEGVTRLRLDAEGVARLVHSTIDRHETALRARYGPAWDDWPANAQMACHGLAWAVGSGYEFPKMDACLRARDFDGASFEVEMSKASNPGNHLEGRNEAHRILMLNAGRVQAYKLDPDAIDWERLIGVHDAETLPELPAAAETPLPLLITPLMGTVYPRPVPDAPTLHVDPGSYLRPEEWGKDDPDPDAA